MSDKLSLIPKWVTETPDLSLDGYYLSVLWNGEAIQDIKLTVEEYTALKRQLAISRGLIKEEDVVD